MTLQWTEDTEVRSSLVLYQVPGDEFEYVALRHVFQRLDDPERNEPLLQHHLRVFFLLFVLAKSECG
ncbi:hypothetical protein N0V85_001885 [Neurospora sp. IMI 360204]|nr:hypothetical protein N0V85_001885 [Neurospora sp. IMI 360204]